MRSRFAHLLPLFILSFLLFGGSRGADEATPKKSGKSPVAAALNAAVLKNLDYCGQWLAAGDFKSLEETAGFVGILHPMLLEQGDDSQWTEACKQLSQHTVALQAAAKQENAVAAKQEISSLRSAAEKLSSTETGRPQQEPERPPVSLGLLMKLLDGTYADAKAACTFDEPAVARQNAIVLAELGELVSNRRMDARWRKHAAAMITAARATAADKLADAKTVRSRLSGVYQHCEACHNRDR